MQWIPKTRLLIQRDLLDDDGIKELRDKYFFKIKEHIQNKKVIFEVLHSGEVKNVAPERSWCSSAWEDEENCRVISSR